MATHSSILVWRIPWMDGGAWWATVHGVAKSWARLSDFTFFLSTTFALHFVSSLRVQVAAQYSGEGKEHAL